jgi:hypothetical protein
MLSRRALAFCRGGGYSPVHVGHSPVGRISSSNSTKETGKTPEEFKKLAEKEGLLQPGVKAGAIVAWLKRDFGLGHGHAMAIYATFKGRTK